MRGRFLRKNLLTAVLLAPATLWLVVFLVLPFVAIAVFSVGERAPEGGYQAAFTFAQYANLPARATAFWNTMVLAPVGALACLLVAYPVAYYLALRAPQRWRLILLALIVIPFWTSLLMRTYAWMYILGGRGIPALLAYIGIEDLRLINTPGAVLLGIVYGYLPLMILPIYVSLERLDRRLLEASADLGATPLSTFLGVTLRLSLPGVMTGFSLVMILLLGEYLIPTLLGGGKVFFIGNALVDLFLQSRNWPFGSAIAITLVLVSVVVLIIANRLSTRLSGARRVDPDLMRAFVVAVFAFLYLPIALVVLFSFNAGHHASEFTGFSEQWYGKALSNPFLVEALKNSLFIATTSALLAAFCGTAAALGLQRVGARTRGVFDALLGAAIVVPGVVIGISTLVALVQLFAVVNPFLASVWPTDQPPRLALGYGSIIAAHGLFSMALVTMIVGTRLSSLDRNLVEASSDLYATPLTTFRSIVLPQIMPAVIAGFLLAFTFSFDDFIIAFFVAGAQTTLPIYVFASIRRGVTPEINAIATIVLAASVLLVLLAQWQLGRRKPSP